MLEYIISYFFQLHLMLYTYVQKFDVMGTAQTVLETKRSLRAADSALTPNTASASTMAFDGFP